MKGCSSIKIGVSKDKVLEVLNRQQKYRSRPYQVYPEYLQSGNTYYYFTGSILSSIKKKCVVCGIVIDVGRSAKFGRIERCHKCKRIRHNAVSGRERVEVIMQEIEENYKILNRHYKVSEKLCACGCGNIFTSEGAHNRYRQECKDLWDDTRRPHKSRQLQSSYEG